MASPDNLILGLGPGLFAVILTFIVAFVIFLAVSYVTPDNSFFVFIGTMLLPLLVFGIVMSAPFEPSAQYEARQAATSGTNDGGFDGLPPLPSTTTTTVAPGVVITQLPASRFYKTDGPTNDTSPISDNYLPVRIVVLLLGCLGVLLAAGYSLVIVLTAPPYSCPEVKCRRKLLEELHPTWYR